MEWKYVGETGVEVKGRNSHSLSVIKSLTSTSTFLVLYGGASGEYGPLSETFYAALPLEDDIGMDFYVDWKQLLNVNSDRYPCEREMHGSCAFQGALYVSGGRNEGQLLTDVWKLTALEAGDSSDPSLQWTRLLELELPLGRCAHGGALVVIDSQPFMCIFGGFTSNGEISEQLLAVSLDPDSALGWKEIALSEPVGGRFGLSMTPVDGFNSIAIFGGVNAEKDFNEVLIVSHNSSTRR